MALTVIEEPTQAAPDIAQIPPAAQKPMIHHTSKRGTPTFRTKSLPASGAQRPPSPPPDVITTPCDPWPRPYYLKDGLRRVMPYHYTYNTYCKERWRGRTLLDIFASEFRDRPISYYKDAIERGYITLNGKTVLPEHVIKNGDVISHTLHRHEPPVTADEVGIVHEDDNMLVIDKPAGVPVHPSGRYNYNSVVEILRAQRNDAFNPMPCNRLDRLTSGIMFIGKERRATEKLGEQIMGRQVRKEYVARAVGRFPDGEVVCDQPVLQISPKLGLNSVRANGKEAKTVFKRLAWYPPAEDPIIEETETSKPAEGDTHGMPWKRKHGYSIVRCLPITGRQHQIRVHLQFLGHPITNDPIYCNQRVFGSRLGQGRTSDSDDESVLEALSRMGKSEVADAVAYHDEMVEEYNKRKAEKQSGENCEVCNTPLYSDPGIHELGIYLHALRYAHANGDWEYETQLPKWALPPEGAEGPTRPTEDTDPLTAEAAKLSLDEAGSEKQKTGG